MQPLIDEPIQQEADSELHTTASVSVLDRLARQLAVITAVMSPLLPMTSLPLYLAGGVAAVFVHVPTVIVAVLIGVYRDRFRAPQIAWVFFLLVTVTTATSVWLYGARTPLILLPGFGVVVLALFTNRRKTLIGGIALLVMILGETIWLRFGGSGISAVPLNEVWPEIASWVGVFTFAIALSVTMLSRLVYELEVANQAERQQREHRWLAERGAQQSVHQLQQLLDSAPVGITLLDEKGDITGWNKINEVFLGVTSEDMLGTSCHDFIQRADQSHPLLPKLAGLYKGQPFYNLVLEVPTQRGVCKLLMSGKPIFDKVGRVSGAITIGVEISSLIRHMGDFSLAPVSEEIAKLAHDIRSPLMALGLSMESLELMLESEYPDLDRIRTKLPIIMQQQVHAAEVVESYYEGLRERDARESTQDPERLATSAVDVLRASLVSQQIEVTVDATLAEEVALTTQPVLVRQVLINLMGNSRDAILSRRANGDHPGRIAIIVEANPEFVVWSVEDNGGGELPDDPQQLFARGYTTKAVGEGTGMGLFISRATAVHLGGNLDVSQGAEGLIFSLSLPRTLEHD